MSCGFCFLSVSCSRSLAITSPAPASVAQRSSDMVGRGRGGGAGRMRGLVLGRMVRLLVGGDWAWWGLLAVGGRWCLGRAGWWLGRW